MPYLDAAICPVPSLDHERILLGQAAGGKLTTALINDVFLPAFRNPVLERMDDQAALPLPPETDAPSGLAAEPAARLALTTDSFVVTPIEFPGGDIGSLAVHGTVNDLAMGGARPLYLSAAFILEEGLEQSLLRHIVASMAAAAAVAGVSIVTGDTKVVNRGKGDGIYITTTGVGLIPAGLHLSADQARPGDIVLLSGPNEAQLGLRLAPARGAVIGWEHIGPFRDRD